MEKIEVTELKLTQLEQFAVDMFCFAATNQGTNVEPIVPVVSVTPAEAWKELDRSSPLPLPANSNLLSLEPL